MSIRLIQRKSLWWPTLWGWAVLVVAVAGTTCLWWFKAESFFSLTDRRSSASVLVVESWIGFEGLAAAQAEFERGGYEYLVSAGGLSDNRWDRRRWNLAHEARDFFVRAGVPSSQVLEAWRDETTNQRTFATAVAAWQALRAAGVHPQGVNVFTLGPHARRSRLVFAKVFGPEVAVGVISWAPPRTQIGPWWRSSERAEDLIKESVGWPFELFLNSGRLSNSPAPPPR